MSQISSPLAQGFVILTVENCRAYNWARIYLSKITGEKKIKACGPDRQEIFDAVRELLPKCRSVVLLTRAYPKGMEWDPLIRDIEHEFSQIEVVRLPHT